MNDLRKICAALGQNHAFEIIVHLRKNGPRHMKKISRETGIPYTTVQKRIGELEECGLVKTERTISRDSFKGVKKVSLVNFRHILTPEIIREEMK